MLTETMKQSLLDLGIDPTEARVLKVLPLVYVAWADGTVVPMQRSRVLEIAGAVGISGQGQELVERHLARRPSDDYFHEGFRLLRSVAGVSEQLDVEPEDFVRVLSWCEAVARVRNNRIGGPDSVGPRERAALDAIAGQLGLEPRTSWSDVEGELSQDPELTRRAPPVEEKTGGRESTERETSLRRERHLNQRA